MKFVDEATIDVIAGSGGNGCMSFRREKFIPFGGPNGGDGGRGGGVYAVGDRNLNTLIDFRYARRHEARNGEAGRGSDQFGAAADDIVLRMPVGTIVSDAETGDVIAELLVPGERVLLAKGGDGGFGNLHFKTSTNRAPRKKTPGWPGEQKKLRLELRVLADVGEHAQLEPELLLFTGPARRLLARRAVGAGLEVQVAEATVAALGQQHPLTRHQQFSDHVARLGIADDRAHGHAQHDVVGRRAELVRTAARLAVARLVAACIAEVDQGVQVAVADCIHAAPTTAVAAVGTAERDELLATEAHATVAAAAGNHIDGGFVDEFHGVGGSVRPSLRAPPGQTARW